ncbi:hypothetical protein [Hyphomonas sp.]|uniref:PKD domain-containing protein n=1 Tax=Hyphomonas sp. TaxID=87 RepID=UPI0025BADA68|nr:hypothetical protein [Hyphomonas sp.]
MTLRSTQRLKGAAAAVFAGLTLAACGGGGGSGGGSAPVSPPTPPPPPPVNAAPTAQATASPTAPQEGQPFTLNASASTDPEGAALTYSWTQLSGPPVPLTAPNQAVLQLAAAEVTEDTGAVFRVSVSDGTNTSSTDVSVTFVNIDQTPLYTDISGPVDTLTLPDRPLYIWGLPDLGPAVVSEQVRGGDVSLSRINIDPVSRAISVANAFGIKLAPDAQLSLVVHALPGPIGTLELRLTALEPSRGHVRFLKFTNNTPQELEEDFRLSAPGACGFFGTVYSTPSFTNFRRYYLGLQNTGLSVYDGGSLQDETATVTKVADFINNQSLCNIALVGSSVFGNSLSTGSPFVPFLRLNEETQTLEFYTDFNGSGNYTLVSSSPVVTGIPSGQRLAGTRLYYGPGNATQILMLYTDDNHQGQHRLVVAGIDDTGDILQSQHAWPLGIPGDIRIIDGNGDGLRDVVIVSPTSPQAIIFSQTGSPSAQNPMGLTSEPRYLEIGLGASSLSALGAQIPDLFAATYPEKKELRIFARD